MADGFLGRWSQRKQAQREGKPLDEPVKSPQPHSHESRAAEPASAAAPSGPASARALEPAVAVGQVPQPEPVPTLDDVKALNADSSYAPFVSRNVSPEVRNAAMKKLFTDPHYNVMDRLDIYIDDYSLADPVPAAMLRQMASAKFLNLFDEEPVSAATNPSENTPHDHTDLRLQPDDAARFTQPECVTEPGHDAALKLVPPRST
jgi:hypothetical protein